MEETGGRAHSLQAISRVIGPVWPTCSALYTSPSDCLRGATPAEERVSGCDGLLDSAPSRREATQPLSGARGVWRTSRSSGCIRC